MQTVLRTPGRECSLGAKQSAHRGYFMCTIAGQKATLLAPLMCYCWGTRSMTSRRMARSEGDTRMTDNHAAVSHCRGRRGHIPYQRLLLYYEFEYHDDIILMQPGVKMDNKKQHYITTK